MRSTVFFCFALLLQAPEAFAQIAMSYAHQAGSISPESRSLFGGDILKSNSGPYSFQGSGTNKIRIVDPSVTPPEYELLATVGPTGLTSMFYGGSVTGTMSISGVYSVSGAPSSGAIGILEGSTEYYNFLTAVGLSKLTGSASTNLTSRIVVSPFATQTPGPTPATTTLSAPVGVSTAGNLLSNVTIPYTNSATGIKNGSYPVNVTIKVTASRTHGAVQATAGWYGQDFMWTLTPPPTGTPGSGSSTKSQTQQVGSLHTPAPRIGNVTKEFLATSPENLILDAEGALVFSAVDEESLSDLRSLAVNGPNFYVANATGMEYLSDLEISPEGEMYALQLMSFHDGQFDPEGAQLFTVDPYTGQTAAVALSYFLEAPSALAFPLSGFGGAKMLITELGLGNGTVPDLLAVDASGNVTPLLSDLGIENPVDMRLAPANFGEFANDAFVVNVGSFTETSAVSNSGSIVVVDDAQQSTSTFASGLKNPIAAAFASGTILGDPGEPYLYVLEQGDLDPTSGIPQGNGTLAAYDANGNRTQLVSHILGAASLRQTPDQSGLYFSDGQAVYALNPARHAVWDGSLPVGAVGDGTSWNSASNWTSDDTTDALPTSFPPGHDVLLPATTGAGIIYLGQDQVVNSIRFEGDYTLAGNILTVSSGALRVSEGVNSTIDSTLVLPSFDPEHFPSVKIGKGALVANGWVVGDLEIVEGRFDINGLLAGDVGVESGVFGGSGLVDGDVHVQRNGVLSPGMSTGILSVRDVILDDGSLLHIELAGNADADQLVVNDAAVLGGELSIDLLAGFTPGAVDSFTVLTAATLSGQFMNVSSGSRLATVGQEGSFLVSYDGVANTIVLSDFLFSGDFDADGDVDGLDFLKWQRGESPDPFSASDLAAWQSNYGAATASSPSLAIVPEPNSLLLFGLGGLALCRFRRAILVTAARV